MLPNFKKTANNYPRLRNFEGRSEVDCVSEPNCESNAHKG